MLPFMVGIMLGLGQSQGGLIPPLDFCFVIFQYLADLHFDLIL